MISITYDLNYNFLEISYPPPCPCGTDGVCQCPCWRSGGLDLIIQRDPPRPAFPAWNGVSFFSTFFGPFLKTLLDSLLQRLWSQLGPPLGSFWALSWQFLQTFLDVVGHLFRSSVRRRFLLDFRPPGSSKNL